MRLSTSSNIVEYNRLLRRYSIHEIICAGGIGAVERDFQCIGIERMQV